MFESVQNQPKSDSRCKKYLIVNTKGIFDPIVTPHVNVCDDLVMKQLEEGIFSVLKHGKHLIEYLEKLAGEQGFSIVLYANCKEEQIIEVLEVFRQSCKREGLKELPKIAALAVKDREVYPRVRASNPTIIGNRFHGILIVGYGSQPREEVEILDGVSKAIGISESNQNSHIVLDNHTTFVTKLIREGWNAYDTSSKPLKNLLAGICSEGVGSKSNSSRIEEKGTRVDQLEERSDNDILLELETCDDKTKKIIETHEKHQNEEPAIKAAKYEFTQRSEIMRTTQTLVLESHDGVIQNPNEKGTAENRPDFETKSENLNFKVLLDKAGKNPEFSSDKDLSQKIAALIPQTKNQKAEDKPLEEFKEKAFADDSKISRSENSLISEIKFKLFAKEIPKGSSVYIRWFINEFDKNDLWIGKCSPDSIVEKNGFNEYKEFLASIIYEFFGVSVPKYVLSNQVLDKEFQKKSKINASDLDSPRLHFMSNFIPGFTLLGDQYLNDYKSSAEKNRKQPYGINFNGEKIPLKGFGRLMAIAILIDDFDFVGNTGKNVGYVPKANEKAFEIIKIDPGEALNLKENLIDAKPVHNPLGEQLAVYGTQGGRIKYSQLNISDQRDFLQTLKEVLEVNEFRLKTLFQPFFGIDNRFETILEELLNRRKELLIVFSSPIRDLIDFYIHDLEERQAQRIMGSWNKPVESFPSESDQKAGLLRDKAQLEAFAISKSINSTEPKESQFSYKKVKFVGRDSELSQISEVFNSNSGIIGCAVVGSAGIGKTQLVTEYIIRYQKEVHSLVLWLYAEQSNLILDQMQIYLETCFNFKVDPEDKNKKTKVINGLYQMLCKKDNIKKDSIKNPCIIFDNAESLEKIKDYLPDEKTFSNLQIDLLVTSRYKKWENPFNMTMELQGFETKETQDYIKKCLFNSKICLDDDQLSKDVEEFNILLEGLPLAVSLAVAYIQQKKMSISEFCTLIAEKNTNEFIHLESCQDESEQMGNELKSPNFVSTILTLALTDLRLKNSSIDPILDVMAYLSPEGICKSLLKECWWQCCQKKTSDIRLDSQLDRLAEISPRDIPSQQEQEGRKELFENKISIHEEEKDTVARIGNKEFDKALELMFSYSVASLNPSEQIQKHDKVNENACVKNEDALNIKIHRLTQQVIQQNHRKSKVDEECFQNVLDWVLAGLDYEERDMKDVKRAGFMVPHGIYLATLHKDDPHKKTMAQLCYKIGYHQLNGAGKYDVAVEFLQRALAIKEKNYGGDHPEIGATLNILGDAWRYLGDYERQKDSLTRALEINEKHYGKHHFQTAITLTTLGDAWGSLGDAIKQRDLCTRALEILEKHNGRDHPEICTTLHRLGTAWVFLGEYKKGKDCFTRALEIREKYFGRHHPQTGIVYNNLGVTLRYLGDYEAQKDLQTRALKIFEHYYGGNHIQTCLTLAGVGNSLNHLGYPEEGKELLKRSLLINQQFFHREDHPTSIPILTYLGQAFFLLKDYEQALSQLNRSLELIKSSYEDGKNPLSFGLALMSIGDVYFQMGDLESALNYQSKAYLFFQKRFGESDMHAIESAKKIEQINKRREFRDIQSS